MWSGGWRPCSPGLGSGSGAAQPCGLGPGLGRGESVCWSPRAGLQNPRRSSGVQEPGALSPAPQCSPHSSQYQQPAGGRVLGSQCPPNLCGHREARPRGSGPPVLAQVWMKPPQLSAVRRVWMSVPGGGQQGSRLYIRCVLFIPSQPTHVRALVGEVSLSEIWREQRKGPKFFPLCGGW